MYSQNGQCVCLALKRDRQVLKISPQHPTLRLTEETHVMRLIESDRHTLELTDKN